MLNKNGGKKKPSICITEWKVIFEPNAYFDDIIQ